MYFAYFEVDSWFKIISIQNKNVLVDTLKLVATDNHVCVFLSNALVKGNIVVCAEKCVALTHNNHVTLTKTDMMFTVMGSVSCYYLLRTERN